MLLSVAESTRVSLSSFEAFCVDVLVVFSDVSFSCTFVRRIPFDFVNVHKTKIDALRWSGSCVVSRWYRTTHVRMPRKSDERSSTNPRLSSNRKVLSEFFSQLSVDGFRTRETNIIYPIHFHRRKRWVRQFFVFEPCNKFHTRVS